MTDTAGRSALVITGPTAVGKSSLALALAEETQSAIVSADSRQVYVGMDVGTAKPTPTDRAQVQHVGVDLLPVGARYTPGLFTDLAVEAFAEGNIVVVGGSSLYIHALVQGISEIPPIDSALESALMHEASTPAGAQRLYDELARADPRTAATLDPTKTQRLVRWVGVIRSSEALPSELWNTPASPPFPTRLVVLTRSREQLYARIEQRVDDMLTQGLIDEIAVLLANADEAARHTLHTTIGYRELIPVLEGSRPLEEAVRLLKRNTRRYAKRQLTWFRRYEDAIWLDASSATPASVLKAVAPWPQTA